MASLVGARGCALGVCVSLLLVACGEDKTSSSNTAGSGQGGSSSSGAGQGNSAGKSSPAGSGQAGSGASGTSNGGTSNAGTSNGGTSNGGMSGSGKELAASLTACKPECPGAQYCALLEVDCSGANCVVNAVCKDRPICTAATKYLCPKSPMETCVDDPDDACTPDDPGCNGVCNCNFNAHPCSPQALDLRPSVCACVDLLGTTEQCYEFDCPDGTDCAIELGKGYCVKR
jgi:hypothetical protein